MSTFCTVLLFTLIVNVSLSQDNSVFFPGSALNRSAVVPASYVHTEKPTAAVTVRVSVDVANVLAPASGLVLGNNANVYMTQMVDQPVLLDHIKTLSPELIRFPGGNLSSVYFWNAGPGTPPADAPLILKDADGNNSDPGYWYGRNDQSWTLSLDNFYSMLEETNGTAILTVNYGYARYSTAPDPVATAAHLAAEWVRYDNGRTRFWEIGNESNGTWQAGYRIDPALNKDRQPEIITGELYGTHFRVFADSMRKAAAEIQHEIFIGAQLLAEPAASWWNTTDRNWNNGVFHRAGEDADFYIIHSYYTPYQVNSSAADILNSGTVVTENMIEYVRKIFGEAGLPQKPVAMTEWNIFAEGSKQQVSFINGMHAAIVTGELLRNKYALACRWNLANGWNNGNDHGMFSQGDQPGVPKWHPRPAFYFLYYFNHYLGDHILSTQVSGSGDVVAYASRFSSGELGLVIVNKGKTDHAIAVDVVHFGFGDRFYFHSLTGGSDNGEFSLKVFVNGTGPSLTAGGPPEVESIEPRSSEIQGGIKVLSPGRSVQYMLVETGGNIITATKSTEDNTSVEVYPNPAYHQTVTVRFPSGRFTQMEIITMEGRTIQQLQLDPGATSAEIGAHLWPGLYTLLLRKGPLINRKKLIIY